MVSDAQRPATDSVATSCNLLTRVKTRDGSAWRRFVQLYSPMVYRWARRAGLQPCDAQDVVQNVFLTVASDIGRFRRDGPGDSFRGWLWAVCRHKILDQYRDRDRQAVATGGTTGQRHWREVSAPEPDRGETGVELARLRHRALALAGETFEPHVWQAFVRTALHGNRPADVARDLGVSVSTVYRAKFRVLTHLRAELDGL